MAKKKPKSSMPHSKKNTKTNGNSSRRESAIASDGHGISPERVLALEVEIQQVKADIERLKGMTPPREEDPFAFARPALSAFRSEQGTVPAVPEGIPEVPLLPGATSLRDFMSQVQDLTLPERREVANAAINMLEGLFVHLPLKRAMHGIDPIQRLKLLRRRLQKELEGKHSPTSAQAFHAEMIDIFHSLRDLHTNYILPRSYQGYTAFLPFLVQDYFEGSPPSRRYVVTRLAEGFSDHSFKRGVRIISWNGIPIDRAVEIVAAREAGSNEDARHARGVESLTLRSMALAAAPDEDWVIVGYEADGLPRQLKMPWMVMQSPSFGIGVDTDSSEGLATAGDAGRVMGFDGAALALQRAKKSVFFPSLIAAEQKMASALAAVSDGQTPQGADFLGGQFGAAAIGGSSTKRSRTRLKTYASVAEASAGLERAANATTAPRAAGAAPFAAPGSEPVTAQNSSLLPEFFSFRPLSIDGRSLGYIRIYSFMSFDPNAFVAEFIRMAKLLPQEGLVIDVRGNGGGNINAGEMLLQVLTGKTIEPERFHFINSEQTLALCRSSSNLEQWVDSIDLAIETAEMYSQGFPLTPPEVANSGLWRYPGKVILLIDALCYSTTDIFTAGFQDHQVGKILGTTSRTGAGGANVWTYDFFANLPDFGTLPKSVTFRTAIRRSTRVGAHVGVPLEDLGVQTKDVHQLTRNDVLNGNEELFKEAARLLFNS